MRTRRPGPTAGLGTLVRAFARRDRWMVLWWTLGIVVLYWSQAVSVRDLYATQAELDRVAAGLEGNAAMVALAGPARALDSIGGQVFWQASAFGAVAIALLGMFLVGRHTRAEEETGRDELVRALPIARTTPLTATLVWTLAVQLVVGVAVALSLVLFPLAAADSLATGLGLAATGWVFTAVALLAAQLGSTVRSAYALTGVAIGAAYVARAVGDLGTPALTWISPIGWYQGVHAFSGVRWWPVGLLVAAAVCGTATAYAAFGRRDFGDGLLPSRPGPARASGRLVTPLGLAWRLQRGSVVGWSLGLLLVGLAYGSLGDDVGDLVGDSAGAREVLLRGSADVVDGFYAVAVVLLALMAAGFAVSSALRPRAEAEADRAESLLATGMSRTRWLLAHLTVTVLGTATVVVAGGVGLGASYALVSGDGRRGLGYLAAALPPTAAVLVLAAVVVLLHGWWPRAALLGWLGLVWCLVVMFLGPLLRMPGWIRDLSPFEHLAALPVEPFGVTSTLGPTALLVLIAVAVGALGVLGFRRRDVV